MAQKLYRQVGKQIKTYRKLANITQEKLAEQADLSTHFLGVIERGDGKPTLDALEAIATALGIKIEALFYFSNQDKREAKELILQITQLLKNRPSNEILMFRNLIVQVLEAFSSSKQRHSR